jgi:hypothetical protein
VILAIAVGLLVFAVCAIALSWLFVDDLYVRGFLTGGRAFDSDRSIVLGISAIVGLTAFGWMLL